MTIHFSSRASIFLAIITILSNLPVINTSASSCVDVEIIFARGSGSAANTNEDYNAFKSTLSNELSNNTTISSHFYDLGTTSHGGHQYPAVTIEDPQILLGTIIGSGQAFIFGESVKEGIAELKSYIDETNKLCSNTKFILAGYSQGAMVISYALKDLDPEKILYAATFGDPKLYLPEGKPTGFLGKPLACAGKNLSNYRIDVPDCEVESGILGALDPYQLSPYTDKLGAWCNEADFMCGSYFDLNGLGKSGTYEGRENSLAGILKAHLSYKTDNSYTDAAKFIIAAIAKAYPSKASASPISNTHQDIAILLDITGSMSSLINQYRQEALKLAQKVKDANGDVNIYTYGDQLRENVQPELLCDTTCSLDEISERLNSLSVQGGDDEPESALSALLHVMNTKTWKKGTNKSIVLITDASYHSIDVNGITLNDVVQRSYEIDPVNIFTITPDEVATNYSDLTTQTGGKIFSSITDMTTSTDTIIERPYISIGETHFNDTPPATITNHSITYIDSSATINLSTNSTSAFFLSLDNAPLGITTNHTFTLTDLPANSILTITPINSGGRTGSPLILALSPPSPKDNINSPRNDVVISPKTPNCGAGPSKIQ